VKNTKTNSFLSIENVFRLSHLALKIVTTLVMWLSFFWFSWLFLKDIWSVVLSYFGDITKIFSSQILTRVGLILQFVGLFVVVPDLIKRESADRWESWFHTASKKSRNINFTMKNLLLVSPLTCFEIDGVIGFINLIGRGIFFLYLLIMVLTSGFWNMMLGPVLGKIMVTGVAIFWICGWFFLTYIYLQSKIRRMEISGLFKTTYSFFNLATIAIWFVVFIPLSLLVLIVLKALSGIAENPLEKILTRATFPFILIGTGLELIGSFV
jgi:hypothetical protein